MLLSIECVFNRQLALLRGDCDAKHFEQWLDVFYDHGVLNEDMRAGYIEKCKPLLDIHYPLDSDVVAARDKWFKKHLNNVLNSK